jgi:hypothetical protein
MSSRSSPTRLTVVPITHPFEGRSDTCDFAGCRRWTIVSTPGKWIGRTPTGSFRAVAYVASTDINYFMAYVSNEPYEIERTEMTAELLLSTLLKAGQSQEQLPDRLRALLDEWQTGQKHSITRSPGTDDPLDTTEAFPIPRLNPIPAEHRTKPITKAKAGELLGIQGNNQTRTRGVNARIDNGGKPTPNRDHAPSPRGQ